MLPVLCSFVVVNIPTSYNFRLMKHLGMGWHVCEFEVSQVYECTTCLYQITHSAEHRGIAVVLLCIREIPRSAFGWETNSLDQRLPCFISVSLVNLEEWWVIAYSWSQPKKQDGTGGLNSPGSGQILVAGCREPWNDPSGCIKCWKFLDLLSD